MRIGIVYFSATQVTATYAAHIGGELERNGCQVDLIDITSHASRSSGLDVDRFDGLIFGSPVFADFVPEPLHSWLPLLEGAGEPCALFLTYGARTCGYSHFHTSELLRAAGLRVLFTAEFLGRHSFNVAGWTVIPDRPNQDDLAVATEFAQLALSRFADPSARPLPLQKPFRYDRAVEEMQERDPPGERTWTNPVRMSEECSKCRQCERDCPTEAFDAESGVSDFTLCISCMRCVHECPDQVIKVDERMKGAYEQFKRTFHLTEEMMEAKRSRVITESWQAVS
jgi:NAD-dependent dihydropyrimidine dehydrogenase PreA subunit